MQNVCVIYCFICKSLQANEAELHIINCGRDYNESWRGDADVICLSARARLGWEDKDTLLDIGDPHIHH